MFLLVCAAAAAALAPVGSGKVAAVAATPGDIVARVMKSTIFHRGFVCVGGGCCHVEGRTGSGRKTGFSFSLLP